MHLIWKPPTSNWLWQINHSPKHGIAVIDPHGENLFYTPDTNFSGIDTFSVKVTDAGGINYSPPETEIPIQVDVTAVNDPPVILTQPPSDNDDSIGWSDEFFMNIISLPTIPIGFARLPSVSLETLCQSGQIGKMIEMVQLDLWSTHFSRFR